MRGQETTQDIRQKLGQRVGVGQHADMADGATGVGAQGLVHALGVGQQEPGVRQQGVTRRGQINAVAAAFCQFGPDRCLHAAQAGAGRGERQIGLRGTGRDAAGFGDVAEQAQVSEVETKHGRLRIPRRQRDAITYFPPPIVSPSSPCTEGRRTMGQPCPSIALTRPVGATKQHSTPDWSQP